MKATSTFSAIKQGILICDKNGKIVYFNDAYREYIGHDLEEIKGHKITAYRKNALVPLVIKSKNPIENTIRQEHGIIYYASIYPILENDTINGTISIISSINHVQDQIERSGKTLAQRVRDFERREIQMMVHIYGSDTEAKKKIAKELGISLATLYNKLNE